MIGGLFVLFLVIGLWRLCAKVPDEVYEEIGLMPEKEDEYL